MADSYSGSVQERYDRANAASATEASKNATGLASHTSVAGTGLGAKAKPMSGAPKQSDFGGDLKAWGEAMRKYRTEMESKPEAQGQKRALQRMP